MDQAWQKHSYQQFHFFPPIWYISRFCTFKSTSFNQNWLQHMQPKKSCINIYEDMETCKVEVGANDFLNHFLQGKTYWNNTLWSVI